MRFFLGQGSKAYLAVPLTIIMVFSALSFMSAPADPSPSRGQADGPARGVGVYGNGPIVNRSFFEITVNEGFADISGDDFLFVIGKGSIDLFYDPNYEWKEWEDIPYPNETFTARYPHGYSESSTPIEITFVHYYDTENFGQATLKCKDTDFNSVIYYETTGLEWFVIQVYAENASGISKAEIRVKVMNVNDRPGIISTVSFFCIAFDEDTSFEGINANHDQLDDVFGDLKDPFDVLTYKFTAMNPLAEHLSVELVENGSYVRFTPEPNWSCPYLTKSKRLEGYNVNGFDTFFAWFRFNCSDQDGLFIVDTDPGGNDNRDLYVYINPMNDVPMMESLGDFHVDEDTVCTLQFVGHDVDEDFEQSLIYGNNVTTAIFDRTGDQIEFQEEYSWDRETGELQFLTTNDMVGEYPIAAWVRDRSEENRADYPLTSYPVYGNFTLHIDNLNDPPRAIIDSPVANFPYNTSSLIEFNATRSSDIDIQHGDGLNFTWYKNGALFGYGALLMKRIETPGFYNITVNVTDGERNSMLSVDIEVKKALIPGEIFNGKDIERQYTDNTTAIVLYQSQDGNDIYQGGDGSLDIDRIAGTRSQSIYKITVTFVEPLNFLYTEEILNEPKLHIYFVKPNFNESPVSPSVDDVPTYEFPVPAGNYRYARLEFDLSLPAATYPVTISPNIRILDSKMGVEITLTVVELDGLGVGPDFELYAVAEMKTTVWNNREQVDYKLRSWDATGIKAMPPLVEDIETPDDDGTDEGIPIWLWLVPLILILFILVVIVLLLLLLKRKRPEPQPVVQYQPVPEQSLDEMVFGGPQQRTAQEMYGSPPPPQGISPPSEPVQSLPPVVPESAPVTGAPPPPVAP